MVSVLRTPHLAYTVDLGGLNPVPTNLVLVPPWLGPLIGTVLWIFNS